MISEEHLRYPAGRFQKPDHVSDDQVQHAIDEIAALPEKLIRAVAGLTGEELDTPYRPGGWTLRQVIHHLPDSHMNAYIRFKLAITEENPTIRPYLEAKWAECEEARTAPVELSLDLLTSIHKRWVLFLRSLHASDFDRTYFHPESQKTIPLREGIAMYAWHGRHHLAHVTEAMVRKGW